MSDHASMQTQTLLQELHAERHVLSNGLKILVREIPYAPVSGCWMIYRVGSRNEIPGITGASHWVEHMLFKGGGKLGKGDIGKLVTTLGGEYNGFTSKDFTAYYEVMPAENLETGLFIESERMVHAAFLPQEVESERSVVVSEREGNENDPEFKVSEELYLSAFRFHPYRWSEGGLKEDLLQMTRDELYDHYQKYYVPSNALLVLVSPYSSEIVMPKVEKYFGSFTTRTPPPDPKIVEPLQLGERRVLLELSSEADYLKVAYHTPQFGNEDVYALMMLDAVLSGVRLFAFGPGQTSGRSARLYRALVEKKIATEASSEFWPSINPSVFTFDLTLWEGVKMEKAERLLFEEIEKIKDIPPDKRELERSLAQVKAQYAYTLDGVTRQGFVLGIFEMVIGFEAFASLVQKLEQVTPEDVSRVARKYLTAQNRTICGCTGIRRES